MKYLSFVRSSEKYRDAQPPAALMEAMGRLIEKLTHTGGASSPPAAAAGPGARCVFPSARVQRHGARRRGLRRRGGNLACPRASV